MILQPGSTVERYVVQSLLGQGGMASVYLVRHSKLETLHALKVLSTGSHHVRERLLVEGRVQARLKHPHVVAVTDVLDVAGQPSLLMDFIAGPALDRWMLEHRPSLDEALAVFRGLLAGVGYAHDQGLIHRDIKPGNVLLHVDDHEVVPRVTDFGLVKAAREDEPGLSNPTRTGATMGTPAYMAPEQIRDASSVDQRADMFSLGCILFELVCDRPAFVGADILELFNKVASADYPAPRSLRPDLPDAVVATIDGLLTVDRDARLATCAEALDVLGPGPTSLSLDAPGGQIAASLRELPPPLRNADEPTWNGTMEDAAAPTLPDRAATDNRAMYGALLENDLVDCMIALPGQLFYTTQIP
ncbi:MAG: hypothetical protein EP330_07000, partial [Deltaproteobacteria bacterium]